MLNVNIYSVILDIKLLISLKFFSFREFSYFKDLKFYNLKQKIIIIEIILLICYLKSNFLNEKMSMKIVAENDNLI